MLSDHFVVQADLQMSRPQKKTVSYRKYDAMNMDDFSDELLKSQLIIDPSETLDTLVDQYNDGLKCLLDKHAPMKTKTFVQRATVPWYSQAIQAAKRDRRRMERLWLDSWYINICLGRLEIEWLILSIMQRVNITMTK